MAGAQFIKANFYPRLPRHRCLQRRFCRRLFVGNSPIVFDYQRIIKFGMVHILLPAIWTQRAVHSDSKRFK